MEDISLYHHGIKGQKWGVRRTAEQLGYKIKEHHERKKNEKQEKKAAAAKAKLGVKGLTDDELRDRIARLQAEETYESLIARANQRHGKDIKKSVKDVFRNAGINALKKGLEYGTNQMFPSGDNAKKSNFDPKKYIGKDPSKFDYDTVKEMKKYYDMVNELNKQMKKDKE